MRYALRKQDKIASVYSEAYLKEHIISSLDSYFGKCDDERIRNRALRQKQQHDECHRQHDLYARVKTVHRTVARKKLTAVSMTGQH